MEKDSHWQSFKRDTESVKLTSKWIWTISICKFPNGLRSTPSTPKAKIKSVAYTKLFFNPGNEIIHKLN